MEDGEIANEVSAKEVMMPEASSESPEARVGARFPSSAHASSAVGPSAGAGASPTARPDAPAAAAVCASGSESKSESERPTRGTFREPLWRDVVGEVLREVRQDKQRTLQDVADVARISMPYLSEIERGRKEASSEMLAAATRALGISMTELLVRVQSRLVEYERAAAAPAAYTVGVPQYLRAAASAAVTTSAISAASALSAATVAVPSAVGATSSVSTASAVAPAGIQSREALCLAA